MMRFRSLTAVVLASAATVVAPAVASAAQNPLPGVGGGHPEFSSTDYADTLSGTHFPIKITSYQGTKELGTAVLKKPAKRIVVIDTAQVTGALLYLGVPPVGDTNTAWSYQYGYPRYLTRDHVTEIGIRPNWDWEKIAALHPDLIVGVPAEFDTYYKKFAAIAPTVAIGAESGAPKGYNPWSYYVAQLALLTGRQSQISSILAKESTAAAALKPRLKGYKLEVVQVFPSNPTIANCYDPLFAYLGATVNTSLEKNDCVSVNPEKLDTLSAPNIVIPQNDPNNEDYDYFQKLALFPTLPAAKAKHVFSVPSDFYYANDPISYFRALKEIPEYLTDLPK